MAGEGVEMDIVDLAPVAEWIAVFAGGFFAGAINVVVGAGTLVSFPLLVFLGFPPLTATISNTIGIVPGSVSGTFVYRQELHARRAVVRKLLPASAAGGILGATILLSFPGEVFATVVPWLIGVGTLLVLLGPAIKRSLNNGHSGTTSSDGHTSAEEDTQETARGYDGSSEPVPRAFTSSTAVVAAALGAFALGTYGGYFSAAQGILLIGLLGVLSQLTMQELNAIKNVTVLAVNIIAAIVFVVVSPELIDWRLVGLIAAGAACGGIVGGRFARGLSAPLLRVFVAVVGVTTVVFMVATQ